MDSTLEITRSTQPACTRITAWPALTVPCPVCVCMCVCARAGIFKYFTFSKNVPTYVFTQAHVFCGFKHTCTYIKDYSQDNVYSWVGMCVCVYLCMYTFEFLGHVGLGLPKKFRNLFSSSAVTQECVVVQTVLSFVTYDKSTLHTISHLSITIMSHRRGSCIFDWVFIPGSKQQCEMNSNCSKLADYSLDNYGNCLDYVTVTYIPL